MFKILTHKLTDIRKEADEITSDLEKKVNEILSNGYEIINISIYNNQNYIISFLKKPSVEKFLPRAKKE